MHNFKILRNIKTFSAETEWNITEILLYSPANLVWQANNLSAMSQINHNNIFIKHVYTD